MTDQGARTPTAWRYCGNQIKLWRTAAGLNRRQLAEAAGYAEDTVRSMECGRRRPTPQVLRVADELFGAEGKLLAATNFLEPEKFPPRTQEFMEREADAIALHSYQTLLIPGLLQTEGYARALLNAHYPPLDDETIEQRVAARMERQELLIRKPTAYFGFVVEEAVLRRPVGGPGVMKTQMHRLLEVGELRNVSVQVLANDRGAHAGMNGPLVLLENVDHERFAYEEGQTTSALHSDPGVVNLLTQRHGMIRMQALDTEESARFIEGVAAEW
ncbi:helix-turn-helix transcriptional regulator [Streptomyces sp. A3M-1-3]|uniref:helix-turn-helix domain-containing protein n=1 Tax=Streptomyces sp. A3M-1-3 TaxID=2962044 RepID=UPI0020B7FF2E|nr:helix-turn-helix transcriptional regulator [Streptomyces sp. A3M-1-3]MCP3819923.1 helix-turn-helix transcriptional regulator [Streptomyces sp. A3M-1-3]